MRALILCVAMLIFVTEHLNAQVINNKGAVINVTSGTVVESKDVSNNSGGYFSNFGIINLKGDYLNAATTSNGGTLNILRDFSSTSITNGNGTFRIGRNWTNSGGAISGLNTVIFNGSNNQLITRTGGETFYNLSIENTGTSASNTVEISNIVNVAGTLSLSTGNVNTAGFKLFLSNPAASSLNYNSITESRVLGKFERGIGFAGTYLFPIGNASSYNPAYLITNTISSAGSVLSEFLASPPYISPGNAGLPVADPPFLIDSTYTDGYWNMVSNGFYSSDIDINLDAKGFSESIIDVTRILKRITGGDWNIDGSHIDAIGTLVRRKNISGSISSSGTQFALGKANPLIIKHPRDTVVCEDANPFFTVYATGAEPFTYVWYKDGSVITSSAHYSGNRSATLTINGAVLSDAATYYCVVRDKNRHTTTSNPATLDVKKIPVATVSQVSQDICDSTSFNSIVLGESYGVPGTTFYWSRNNPDGISSPDVPTTGTGMNIGAALNGTFINTNDYYVPIVFTIYPVGPGITACAGLPVTATVRVNPTPRVIPVNIKPDICPAGASPTNTQIVLTSPSVMTSGAMRFDYTVTKTDGFVIGNTAPEINRIPGYTLSFGYQNNSDTIKSVYYHITPKNNSICVPGPKVISEVKVHARPLQDLIITVPLTCEGGSDASLRAITSEGAGQYYFEWARTSSDTVSGYNIPNLLNRRGGMWSVVVTDNLGCVNSNFKFVEGAYFDSYMLVVDTTGFGTTCPGSNDGQIWIKETSSTGIAPFKYWIVRDGQDSTSAVKGTLPATEILQKHYNLLPGNYRLFLKDANGCYDQTFPEVSIIEPEIITVEFGKSNYPGGFNISCKGYSDGSVWVDTIYGGNKGYRYKWSTSTGTITGIDTLNRLDNITAGIYYLTTTDRKGCSNIHTVTITQPDGMQLASSELSHSADGNFNISCDGGNDGSIVMNITGGSGSYLYSWTSPNGFTASTRDISGLKAGVYTCVVSDVNGCVLTQQPPQNPNPQFTLTDPDPLDITLTPSISSDGGYNINCNGGTGSVNTTVTGGSTGNYTYTWSTLNGSGIVQGQKDQPALTAGKYYLDVKDLNNCILRDSITLTQPPVFGIQLTATNITCAAPGFSNGSVNLTVTGGAGAYSYTWSNGASTEDISGLTQGIYQVTVTYNNTCSKTDAVQINLPPPLTYNKELTDYNGYNVSCFGLSDGAINVTPSTGLAPFTYTWTGPDGFTSSSNQISGLKAGSYTLTITDSNYCTATEVIVLTQPGQLGMTINLSASIAGGFNINCAGDSTGTIGIEPLNQVKSVQYIWSDGVIGKSRTGLPAGVYTVIITDENNCHATSAITLTQPDSIKLNYTVKQPFCPDMPDGEIRLNVTGGVRGADYIYKWSDNSSGRNVSNILRGFYKMTVTDMNGCQVKDSVVLEPLNETCLIIPNAISPNDDLINDEWNIGMKELYPQMEIRVFNRWGETVWRSEKGYPKPWDGKSNGNHLPVDSYHYIINLHNGSKPIVGGITIVR